MQNAFFLALKKINTDSFYLSNEVIEYLENKHGNRIKFKAETHKANKDKMPKTNNDV